MLLFRFADNWHESVVFSKVRQIIVTTEQDHWTDDLEEWIQADMYDSKQDYALNHVIDLEVGGHSRQLFDNDALDTPFPRDGSFEYGRGSMRSTCVICVPFKFASPSAFMSADPLSDVYG